jgi:HSP20 family molecular chaperone IbpA
MSEIAIKHEEVITPKIRKVFDVTTNKWYFSVVDTIESLVVTANGQNYWKVLKNRLKKRSPELVTKCNQLKMRATDGKFYLTDVADSATMIGIIEAIPKASVSALKVLIADLEKGGNSPAINISETGTLLADEHIEKAESSLFVDAYDSGTRFIIKAFVAGVAPSDIHIYVYGTRVLIQGKRLEGGVNSHLSPARSYFSEELLWTTFSREIILPSPVHLDYIKKTEYRGMVTFELQKI